MCALRGFDLFVLQELRNELASDQSSTGPNSDDKRSPNMVCMCFEATHTLASSLEELLLSVMPTLAILPGLYA
jgi:hypothetical protein